MHSAQELLRRHGIEYKPTRNGKFTTNCPECGGGYLSVETKRGFVVWYCHRCKWGGPEKSDEQRDSDLGPIRAVYDYGDENGELLFQVVRFEPVNQVKQFRQRKGPDQKKWSIKGVRIVPYRLRELVEDIAANRVVFVVEGEKDVDTLRGRGIPATCNPMGAEKWRPEFNKIFRDADVVICGDCDEPGRKHVELVARNLNGVARRVRILDLAQFWPAVEQGNDITDWFTHGGGSVEQLNEIVEQLKAPGKEKKVNDVDEDAEIKRLAGLTARQYERERKAAADRLGIRATVLDKLVDAERPDDESKQGRAISLPEPELWPEPVNGAALLDSLAEAIRRYVVLPDHSRDAAALWVVHTYLLDCFLISPRLAICSPVKQCGKTTLLDVLACLVLKPLPTANVTASAIFRVIERYRPTALVDEADTFLRDNDELRGIINSGHRRGGAVLRAVGDDFEPRAFSTYSACAIALIGKLPDTLHDRSVVVDLKRRLPSETISPFRVDRIGHLEVLARQAARWCRDHGDEIAAADPTMPAGIFNREADNWRPLLAIAEAAGQFWSAKARSSLEQCQRAHDDEARLPLLLGDIRDIFAAENADRLPSSKLIEELVAIDCRPWAEYGRKTGKPITQNQLARALKPLGIAPDAIAWGDKRPRGYQLVQFGDAFERYLPPKGDSNRNTATDAANTGTSELFQSATADQEVAVRKSKKSNVDGHSSAVAVQNGGEGVALECHHCHRPGSDADPLIRLVDGEGDAFMHRTCLNERTAGQPMTDDDLAIPQFLRRSVA